MKPFLWLLVIPVLFLLNYWMKKSKRNAVVPKKSKEEYLNAIRLADKYEVDGYNGKTKEIMTSLRQRANVLVDSWLDPTQDNDEIRKKTDTFLQDTAVFSSKLKSDITCLEKYQTAYASKIEQVKAFFEEKNFYPPDFTFLANTLYEKHTSLKEIKRTDPTSETKEYEEFLALISSQFDTFHQIHAKVTDTVAKFETIKDSLTEPKLISLLEHKQKIFFALHQGDFKEVEKLISVFVDRIHI